ncbi:hypothetical protein VA7868_01500 [Vibrio aerogenes CECT 7868]|uniref:Uncharacterized protein n=1 Tax=Vibrio aerogenes CECT 7868 TaxID=1216006 RepID=A0A1M5Y6K4_9VIBR|nr:hypothetical protein [Vibrio aerogenes]SHI07123.1 hypothetical protein VA7868_01500 [Vibrio aerogenes CECT 7868]
MNFGNASITLFKILILLAVSGTSFADIIQTKESLESRLQQQYGILNAKIKVCRTYQSRQIKITDKWLLAQTKQVQRVVIGELYKHAMNQCSREEERDYVNTLIQLAAIGEKEPLDQYIMLKGKDTTDSRGLELFRQQHVNLKEIDRLATLPKYQIPFYPLPD